MTGGGIHPGADQANGAALRAAGGALGARGEGRHLHAVQEQSRQGGRAAPPLRRPPAPTRAPGPARTKVQGRQPHYCYTP